MKYRDEEELLALKEDPISYNEDLILCINSINLTKKMMTTIKLTVNENTGKGKHLLALIKELAKSDKDILIENFNDPNRETLKAMKEAEAGLVTMVDNIDELFNSI